MTNITMENHHRSSGCFQSKWWFSIAMLTQLVPLSLTHPSPRPKTWGSVALLVELCGDVACHHQTIHGSPWFNNNCWGRLEHDWIMNVHSIGNNHLNWRQIFQRGRNITNQLWFSNVQWEHCTGIFTVLQGSAPMVSHVLHIFVPHVQSHFGGGSASLFTFRHYDQVAQRPSDCYPFWSSIH